MATTFKYNSRSKKECSCEISLVQDQPPARTTLCSESFSNLLHSHLSRQLQPRHDFILPELHFPLIRCMNVLKATWIEILDV